MTENWNAANDIYDVSKVVLFFLSLGVNCFVFVKYLTRSFEPKKYFSGQWRGHLTGERGRVECTIIFYEERGQLSGQVFYEGNYGSLQVRGFDRLENAASHFIARSNHTFPGTSKKIPRFPVKNIFNVTFSRLIHSVGDEPLDMRHQEYYYEFSVHTRFKRPRVFCAVTSEAEDGQTVQLTGEFSKLANV